MEPPEGNPPTHTANTLQCDWPEGTTTSPVVAVMLWFIFDSAYALKKRLAVGFPPHGYATVTSDRFCMFLCLHKHAAAAAHHNQSVSHTVTYQGEIKSVRWLQ